MAHKDIEIALTELDERVDRLRSLYEQYFMGYEKIEPGVQRKDVDRRFIALRKQQIRNTALRFRFNVITQKFNTYSMYWTRICRQIEEGTFKRHVSKASKRFSAPDAGRKEEEGAVDIEFGSIEEVDMAEILAEADAAAELYGRGGQSGDTVPPSVRPTATAAPLGTNGGHGPDSPSSKAALRAARPASLPVGTKQPVLVRRRPDAGGQPVSTPTIRTSPSPSIFERASSPSSATIAAMAPADTANPAQGASSSSRMPAAPPSSTRSSESGRSSGRLPAAPAAMPSPTPSASRLQAYRPVALPPSSSNVQARTVVAKPLMRASAASASPTPSEAPRTEPPAARSREGS